jgi:valyl-tRNA synthetase
VLQKCILYSDGSDFRFCLAYLQILRDTLGVFLSCMRGYILSRVFWLSQRLPLFTRFVKSNDIIEPILKPQWWMRMQEFATPAIDVVKNGQIKVRNSSRRRVCTRLYGQIADLTRINSFASPMTFLLQYPPLTHLRLAEKSYYRWMENIQD